MFLNNTQKPPEYSEIQSQENIDLRNINNTETLPEYPEGTVQDRFYNKHKQIFDLMIYMLLICFIIIFVKLYEY